MARVPLGIIILAILNILTGILLIVGSVLWTEFGWALLVALFASIPYGAIIVALVYILIGIGLLSLSGWAWYADIIFAIFNLLLIVWDFITTSNIAWISLILNLIIALYLNQGGIRHKFHT